MPGAVDSRAQHRGTDNFRAGRLYSRIRREFRRSPTAVAIRGNRDQSASPRREPVAPELRLRIRRGKRRWEFLF